MIHDPSICLSSSIWWGRWQFIYILVIADLWQRLHANAGFPTPRDHEFFMLSVCLPCHTKVPCMDILIDLALTFMKNSFTVEIFMKKSLTKETFKAGVAFANNDL
jgi:hypothetical protein